MTKSSLVSVIVPCFDEEPVLPLLFKRLTAAADSWGIPWEVVCVDDGSDDGTWRLLSAQARTDSRWRCFALSRNFGHQAALSAGLQCCRGDAALIIDADLQDPPEELIRFIDEWRAGYQVVHGIRETRSDGPVQRLQAWTFYRLLRKMVAFNIPPDAGDFALLDRQVINVLNQLPERTRYLRGLRAWCGFRQKAVPFRRAARAAGSSHYGFAKLLKLATDGALSLSSAPLRLASYLGLAMTGTAVLFALFSLLQPLLQKSFPTLEPISNIGAVILVVTLLAGVQLICVGILGEYIGRIYVEVQGRPAWLIRESSDDLTPGAVPARHPTANESG